MGSIKVIKNPEPIQIKVQDKTGAYHIFTANELDIDETVKLADIGAVLKAGGDNLGDAFYDAFVNIFGKDRTFYTNFNFRVLISAFTLYNEEKKTPIQAEVKKG